MPRRLARLLVSLYPDHDMEESCVIRHYHQFVSQVIAKNQREQEQAEKERR